MKRLGECSAGDLRKYGKGPLGALDIPTQRTMDLTTTDLEQGVRSGDDVRKYGKGPLGALNMSI